jgi:hypothetical protein
MVQMISCRPRTARAEFDYRSVHVRFVLAKAPRGQVLLQVLQFPLSVSFPNVPFSFIHLPPMLYNVFLPVLQFLLSVSFHQCPRLIVIYMLLLPEGLTGEALNLPKAPSTIWEHWKQKYLSWPLRFNSTGHSPHGKNATSPRH